MLSTDTSEGLAVVTGSNRGQDLDLFTPNYMTTKKLTFDIIIKWTRQKITNYVLGTKSVSDIKNGISIAIFYAIREKLGPKTYLDAQYRQTDTQTDAQTGLAPGTTYSVMK